MTSAILHAEQISKTYGSARALHPLDLSLGESSRGSITGLLGPNGSGKSTFLRILIGLVPPDSGEVTVDGVRLAGDGTAVRRRATYAPGEIALFRDMRGDEHLRWLLRGREAGALDRARALAERLNLPLEKSVQAYSHGMKRQLLLAAALAPKLRVRILDEPTEGLDPSKRAQVLELLQEDEEAGATILLSSHHLGEVDRICERMVFLDGGQLLANERSSDVEERARRVMRISFGDSVQPNVLESALAALRDSGAVESTRVEGNNVRVLLSESDPRPFLRALDEHSELPAPVSIQFGELSLSELYRDLYGVEGC